MSEVSSKRTAVSAVGAFLVGISVLAPVRAQSVPQLEYDNSTTSVQRDFRFRNAGDFIAACVYVTGAPVDRVTFGDTELVPVGHLPFPGDTYAGVTMWVGASPPKGRRILSVAGGAFQGMTVATYRNARLVQAAEHVVVDTFDVGSANSSQTVSIDISSPRMFVVGCHANSQGIIEEGTISIGNIVETFALNGYLMFDSATPIEAPFTATISWPGGGRGGSVVAAFRSR